MFEENNGRKTKVAIYIRVSTPEQEIEGFGLDAQRARLIEHLENNKNQNYEWKEEWIFTDVHTGSDLNRKSLNKLREGIKAKRFDAVLIWKIDRLSRNLAHLLVVFEEMEKNEVSFISLHENIDFRGPIGKLMFQVFGAIAQFERELIKGRTQMGKIASAEMGNYTGTNIPYGYSPVENKNGKGRKLEVVKEEARWVKQMFEWYVYEDMGYGQIAKKLNDHGVLKSKYSKARLRQERWTEKVVGNIMQNPLYRGEFIANRKDENNQMLPSEKWTKVLVPACVTELLFQQAQAKCEAKLARKTNTQYLLSSKLKDVSLEGKPIAFVGAKRWKGGFSYRRKQFAKGGVRYPVFEVPAKGIEEYVWNKIVTALKNPESFVRRYLSKEYANPTKIQKLEDRLKSLRRKVSDLGMARSRIEEAYERGSYSSEVLDVKLLQSDEEMRSAEREIRENEQELKIIGSADIEVQKLQEVSQELKHRLDNISDKQKRAFMQMFVDRIEMNRVTESDQIRVSALIYYRFNPSKLPDVFTKDRTSGAHREAKNAKKIPNEGDYGADERT